MLSAWLLLMRVLGASMQYVVVIEKMEYDSVGFSSSSFFIIYSFT